MTAWGRATAGNSVSARTTVARNVFMNVLSLSSRGTRCWTHCAFQERLQISHPESWRHYYVQSTRGPEPRRLTTQKSRGLFVLSGTGKTYSGTGRCAESDRIPYIKRWELISHRGVRFTALTTNQHKETKKRGRRTRGNGLEASERKSSAPIRRNSCLGMAIIVGVQPLSTGS